MSLAYPANLKSVTTKHQLGTNESNENMVFMHMGIPFQFGSDPVCSRVQRTKAGTSNRVETTLGPWTGIGLSHRWTAN